MKILLSITCLTMGGAETQVMNLADSFASRGYRVKVAYLLQPVVVTPQHENVELIWLGGDKSLYGMCKAFKNLVSLIKAWRPDVVHSHMFHPNIMSRLAKVFAKTPRLVCTAHNTIEGGKLSMIAYRLTDFISDKFTNVSQEAVQAFEDKKAAPRGTMLATHNGIDTEHFKFDSHDREAIRQQYGLTNKKVFIAIGRFHEQKDYPNLIMAFRHLANTQTDAHLLIVGDGDLRHLIEMQIRQLRLTDQVTLLGIRNDIPAILSASDVFALSSAYEGFGLVVAEAMATERIVIATDCGGVSEVVGSEGFLIQPGDSDALAEAMNKALDLSPAEAAMLGQRARQRIVSTYSLKKVVDKWEDIYSGKIDEKAQTGFPPTAMK